MGWKSGMSEEDRQLWSHLMDKAVYRIACYLRRIEAEQEETWNRHGEFNETILSLEIHDFFRKPQYEMTDFLSSGLTGSPAALQQRLELDEFQMFCVILVFLSELDYHFEKLFVYVNNDWNQRLLSVEWAIRFYTMESEVNNGYMAYFLPGGILEQRVFDIRPEGAGSGLRKGIKLKQSVLEFLLCSGNFQDKPYLCWNPEPEEHLQSWLDPMVCRTLKGSLEQKEKRIIPFFHIKNGSIREAFLYAAWFGENGKQPLGILDYKRMQKGVEPEQIATVLEEIFLAEAVLCIYNTEYLQEDEKLKEKRQEFLQRAAEETEVVVLFSHQEKRELSLPWNVDYIPIEIQPLTGEQRLQAWLKLAEKLPVSKAALQQVSVRYAFGIQEMEQSLREARRLAYACGEQEISGTVLHDACRHQLEYNLKEWAVPVKLYYSWEDLILPNEQKNLLRQAVNQLVFRKQVYEEWGFQQIRFYGTGLTILFTGPPGTGKTMAAQVLAGALNMELYKIQIPAVVSKYIGETEQNLRQIFQEGQKSGAVLFFDEADVLFSKRTEVKDSHDKYSNMEAAYMLQNMEEYTGVVILATNFPQNIDEAFKRRITLTVEFCLPDYLHRCLLWKQSVPEQLPLEPDVDLEELAERFELSGSNIKNIMINAAFLAASEQSAVGRRHILTALKREFEKSGKYFSDDELQL